MTRPDPDPPAPTPEDRLKGNTMGVLSDIKHSFFCRTQYEGLDDQFRFERDTVFHKRQQFPSSEGSQGK